MHPLLLAALAIGGVVVVRKVFGPTTPKTIPQLDDRRRFVDGRLGRLATIVSADEKFMDPVFTAYGDGRYRIRNTRPVGLSLVLNRNVLNDDGVFSGPDSMADDQPDVVIGYEYLSTVAADPAQRIGAMRRKINELRATPPEEKPLGENDGTLLGNLSNASIASLRSMTSSMFRSYQQISTKAELAESVATKLGAPVSAVKQEAASALESAKSSTTSSQEYAVFDKAVKDYGPVARTAINAVARAIEIGRSSGSLSTGEQASEYLDAAGSVALMIPVYGWIVGAALKGIGAIAAFVDPSKSCGTEQQNVRRNIEGATAAKMPIPWHVFDAFPVNWDTCQTAAQMNGLQLATSKSEFFFRTMPAVRQIHVSRWWAAASTFAAHPKVFEVFAALGADASGGLIASDEQVMLVAAPVAVMYGFDVDELATELYKRAPGWRSAPESFAKPINSKANIRSYFAGGPGESPTAMAPNKGFNTSWTWANLCSLEAFQSYCDMPANAWWLQWSTLAEHAFLIAEEWQKTKVKTIAPVKFKLSELKL